MFSLFSIKKKKSSARRLTPRAPLISRWVSFHRFNCHFLPALVDDAKDYPGREMSLILFTHIMFLNRSSNTRPQPFCASAVLRDWLLYFTQGWCNALETSTFMSSHTCPHVTKTAFQKIQLYIVHRCITQKEVQNNLCFVIVFLV